MASTLSIDVGMVIKEQLNDLVVTAL